MIRTLKNPEPSEWSCRLFSNSDLVWIPNKGHEPNWWVRFWSRIFFGCIWERKAK